MTQETRVAPPGLVVITDKAATEARRLFEGEHAADATKTGLRLGVKGGGCSGLSYSLLFDGAKANDYVIDLEGLPVYVDPKSAIYLKGIVLDFQDGLEGKGFVFSNPNATSTCGCGESFSV